MQRGKFGGDIFTTKASAKPTGSSEPWVALQSWEKGWVELFASASHLLQVAQKRLTIVLLVVGG